MSEENVDSSRRAWERFLAGDTPGALSFLDPDVEVHEPPQMPDAQSYRGHAGWQAQLDRFGDAFTDISYRVLEHIDCGDEVVTVVTANGTATSSGVPGEMTYAQLETWRDGRMVTLRYFVSRDEALQAAAPRE
jgi:ketosteroid isomerase-like protein